MPKRTYKKKGGNYRKFKRAYRKKGFAGGAWSLAKKAAWGVVKRVINSESKYIDNVDNAGAIMSTAGTFVPLTMTAQGDTELQRSGNSIRLTMLDIHGSIFANSASTVTTARIIIFRDSSSAGVVPTIAQVLNDGTNNVHSRSNRTNGTRFTTLWDKTFALQLPGASTRQIVVKKFINLGLDSHVKYIGTTATQASLGQGAIYMLLLSNELTNVAAFAYHIRLRFIDN